MECFVQGWRGSAAFPLECHVHAYVDMEVVLSAFCAQQIHHSLYNVVVLLLFLDGRGVYAGDICYWF